MVLASCANFARFCACVLACSAQASTSQQAEVPALRRHVRQDSDLWDDLHAGVCTTGILNAALGVYEPSACRRLGMPASYASHSKLLGAYERLQQRIYVPPSRVQAQPGSEMSHAQAGMHCSSLVLQALEAGSAIHAAMAHRPQVPFTEDPAVKTAPSITSLSLSSIRLVTMAMPTC